MDKKAFLCKYFSFSMGIYSKNQRFFKAELNPNPKLAKMFDRRGRADVQITQIFNSYTNKAYKYKSSYVRALTDKASLCSRRFVWGHTKPLTNLLTSTYKASLCFRRLQSRASPNKSSRTKGSFVRKGTYVRRFVLVTALYARKKKKSGPFTLYEKPVRTCTCKTCFRSEPVSPWENTVKSKALQKNLLRNVRLAKRFVWNHARYKLLFLWHGDTHSTPINFVYKPASHIKSGFSYIDNESKKSISSQSTKKSILQIINQSRETITRKQLLISVINLRFALVLSSEVRPCGSSRFRIIFPWGPQISDWHHRIQIKNLYPVTYDFPQRNQRFGITKVRGFAPLQTIFRTYCNKYKPTLVRACRACTTNKAYKYKSFYKSDASVVTKLRKKSEALYVRKRTKRSFVRKEATGVQIGDLMPLSLPVASLQISDLLERGIKSDASIVTKLRKQRVALYVRKKTKQSFVRKEATGNALYVRTYVTSFGQRFVYKSYVPLAEGHVRYARFFVRGRTNESNLCLPKRAFNHWRTSFKFCKAKLPQKDSNNIILSISGGQDSIFLLFCLSFLQSQIAFKPKIIWCNHFWQKSSFYTTVHLTKSAMAFSSPIMGFLPFHIATSPKLYRIVTMSLCFRKHRVKKNQNKKSTICKSFFKKQSKQELSTKDVFYKAKTKCRKKTPKAYKKFIKEISETRARNWRHITIERACTFYGSTLSLNGHTLSDRVETILFNLIRGTKNKKFQTLPWKRRHSTFCYNKFYPTFEQVIKKTHIHFI